VLSTYRGLAQKAEDALLGAIEIYNKPSFAYREESFAILALNAWELLLKARLVQRSNNDPRVLWIRERRQKKDGTLSTRLYIRRNRSGNPMTIGLDETIKRVQEGEASFPKSVEPNLAALTEIRDNAVHFFNASPQLAKAVLELGTACLKNFAILAEDWFDMDLTRHPLMLLPIGFVSAPAKGEALALNHDEAQVLEFIRSISKEGGESDAGRGFHVALEVELSFKRVYGDSAGAVKVVREGDGIEVKLSEEDIRQTYPWEYADVVQRCRTRYVDFKQNESFHTPMRSLKKDPRFCRPRYLDPANEQGPKKDFYNPNILKELDAHFTRG
jgi:hypothetical protein